MVARRSERKGRPRWEVELAEKVMPDWVIVARLNAEGSAVQDYCLVAGGYCMISLGDIRHRLLRERWAAAGLGPLVELVVRGKPRPGVEVPGLTGVIGLGTRVRDRASMCQFLHRRKPPLRGPAAPARRAPDRAPRRRAIAER